MIRKAFKKWKKTLIKPKTNSKDDNMDEISNNVCTTELPLEHENLPNDGDSPVQLGKTGNETVNIDNIPSNAPLSQVLEIPIPEYKPDDQEKLEKKALVSSFETAMPQPDISKDPEKDKINTDQLEMQTTDLNSGIEVENTQPTFLDSSESNVELNDQKQTKYDNSNSEIIVSDPSVEYQTIEQNNMNSVIDATDLPVSAVEDNH